MNTAIFIASFVLGAILTVVLNDYIGFDKSTFGLYFIVLSSLFYHFFSNEAGQ